jgi:hypothetical protein
LYFVAKKLSIYATIVLPTSEYYNPRDTTHIKHPKNTTTLVELFAGSSGMAMANQPMP